MVLGLVAALVFCGAAQAAPAKFTAPFAAVIPDPCNGGAAGITGDISVMFVGSGNGTSQLKVWVKGTGEALGPSTQAYNFMAQFTLRVNLGQGAGQFAVNLKAKLVSKGGAENATLEGRFEIHVNANGDITAVKFVPLHIECKG
jgi:hypothetical protein